MMTETRNEAAELRTRIDRGLETIERMRVPAEPDRDPDLILADALNAGLDALTLVAAERLATVNLIRERLESTTSRYHEGHFVKAAVIAMLDAEAAR